ncbi:hypothetical protein BH11BAC3_BH11BAC3_19060 [soil metagenome]
MKQLLLLACLLAATLIKAQPFLSFSTTTNGIGLSAGFLEPQSGIEIATGYNMPVLSATKPHLFIMQAGKRILLTQNEEDNFTITPTIGYANYTMKDLSNYYGKEATGTREKIKQIKAIVGLELGKDWYLGRLFINANYCGTAFYGLGIRAFIK